MADMDADFRKFLESYKATRQLLEQYDNAKTEDEKNKILAKAQSEYGAKYIGWAKLPIELKEKYQTIGAPQWVLDIANERNSNELRILVEHPEINSRQQFEEKVREEEQKAQETYEKMHAKFRASVEAVAAIATPIVLAGYTQKAADELANERLFRDEFVKTFADRKPTWHELAILLASQRKTLEIMHKEWLEHLPERYLMRLLTKYNRPNTSDDEKTKLIQPMVDVIQRIFTEGHIDHFDKYLEHPLVQARLRRFDPKKMDELLTVIGQQIYGGNRHLQHTPELVKEKMQIDTRNLPEDVVSIIEKVKVAQENAQTRRPFEKTRIRIDNINTN